VVLAVLAYAVDIAFEQVRRRLTFWAETREASLSP
jgi:hypothetical protein